MIKISIIIPLYNKAPFILRTMRSVLAQTYPHFEVIIIDDGSTDDGAEKIKKLNDSRINLIHQENKGVSAARNKGISLANHNYVAFLDGDDIWKPDFLESVCNLINKYPDKAFFATSFEKRKKNGEIIEAVHRGIPPASDTWEGVIQDFFFHSINDMLVNCSSAVVKKQVFEELGGFMEGVRYGEDQEMWARIALNYPLVFSNKIGMLYDLDSDNVVSKSGYRELPFLDKAPAWFKKYSLTKKQACSFWQYVYKWKIIKANFCIRMNLRKEALKLLWESRKTQHFKLLWFATFAAALMPHRLYSFIRKKWILKS